LKEVSHADSQISQFEKVVLAEGVFEWSLDSLKKSSLPILPKSLSSKYVVTTIDKGLSLHSII
jgi:hypothetical protein